MAIEKVVPPHPIKKSILNALLVVKGEAPHISLDKPEKMRARPGETVTWVALNQSNTTADVKIRDFKQLGDIHGSASLSTKSHSPFARNQPPTTGVLSNGMVAISATVMSNAKPGLYIYQISINGVLVDPELEIEPRSA
jgi:hypothetical protein